MGGKAIVRAVVSPMLPEFEVALWHSRKRMLRRLGSRGLSPKLLEWPCAQVTVCGNAYHVLDESPKGAPEHERLALLAHEAVHVALGHLRSIGEERYGDEELAYTVQAACAALFEAHIAHEAGNDMEGVRQ